MKSMSEQEKFPTTIVTGFLGAGKTTVISYLIEDLQKNGEQVVYVKNELGDATIDSQIMKGKNIATRELLNGCICCTLTGPFIAAIDELVTTTHPDRIIIEASGTADTAALALMVSGHQKLFRDGVISIIDVINFNGFEDLSETAKNQTKFTDLIIFNKVELTDEERKKAVVGYVRELNNHSPIVESEHGKVATELVFGIDTRHVAQLLTTYQSNADDHVSRHLEHDHIQAIHYRTNQQFDGEQLKQTIAQLPPNVFRLKGIVQLSDDSWSVVQKVGQRVEIEKFSGPVPDRSLLICIGFEVEVNKEEIIEQFKAAEKS